MLSLKLPSFWALLISAALVSTDPSVADALTVAWYDLIPLAPGAIEPRSQVIVLPTTLHVAVQLPTTYVRFDGKMSLSWTPVAVSVADALFE